MVEVVEVRVRDEDPVDSPGVDRGLAAQVPDPPPQNRVGDESRAVDVDHDGAVPQPSELAQTTSSQIEYPGPATFITPFG